MAETIELNMPELLSATLSASTSVDRTTSLVGGKATMGKLSLNTVLSALLTAQSNATNIDELVTPGIWIPNDYTVGTFPKNAKEQVIFVFTRYKWVCQLAISLNAAICIRTKQNETSEWSAWKSATFTS